MDIQYLKKTFFLFPEGDKIIKKLFRYDQDEDVLEAKREIRKGLLIEANKSFIFLKHQEGLNHPYAPFVVKEYIQRIITNNFPVDFLTYKNMIQYNRYLLENTNPSFRQLRYGLSKLRVEISKENNKENNPFKGLARNSRKDTYLLKAIQKFDNEKYLSEEELQILVLAKKKGSFLGLFHESDKKEKEKELSDIINEDKVRKAQEDKFIEEMFNKYVERFDNFKELEDNLFE